MHIQIFNDQLFTEQVRYIYKEETDILFVTTNGNH